jgi:hypothetical protein
LGYEGDFEIAGGRNQLLIELNEVINAVQPQRVRFDGRTAHQDAICRTDRVDNAIAIEHVQVNQVRVCIRCQEQPYGRYDFYLQLHTCLLPNAVSLCALPLSQ